MNFHRMREPKLIKKDLRQCKFIFNILLIGSLILSGLAILISLIEVINLGIAYRGVAFDFLFLVFFIFLGLFSLSKEGYFVLATYIFIGIYLFLAVFVIFTWGVSLPQGLLLFPLIIIMSGIIINSKFAFFVTFISNFIIIVFAYLQARLIIHPDLYWQYEMAKVGDAVVFATTLSLIALVMWLYNREIEQALKRTVNAEKDLKKERDLLEIKIIKKTEALKEAQLEKMTQLYRLASFGRLASGLFHDLASPLSVVSLGARKMENFMQTARRQIQQQEEKGVFSLTNEINQVVQIMKHRADEFNIKIVLSNLEPAEMHSSSLKFSQLIINLISNAIDAYDGVNGKDKKKEILVDLQVENDTAYLIVQDWGMGIPEEYIDKVFDPFFTTKRVDRGVGIGLPICKGIVEKNFGGKIEVVSKEYLGSTFKVEIPLTKKSI